MKLLLLSKKLMKLSEVVKEEARDAEMVEFHFNTGCFFFFHIHLHLRCLWPGGLFHSFLICEKFTLNFATFFVKHLEKLYQQVVLLLLYYAIQEWKLFCYGLLVSSIIFCAIPTSFSFLFEQILFSLLSFASSGYKFPALLLFWTSFCCATVLHKRQVHVVIFIFIFIAFLSYLFCLK